MANARYLINFLLVSLTPPCNMKSILFVLVKFGAVLSEIVGPSNTAVLAGDKMNMNCKTTNNSIVRKWTVYTPNRITSTILQGTPWKLRGDFTHFSVDTNANGPAIISTNSTRLSEAGSYTCRCENDGKDTEYSAHLIVLESLPLCESNITRSNSHSLIDGDIIWIQCSVNYRGFWEPSMEWIQHREDFGPEGNIVTDGIKTMISPSQSVTSKLTIAVNSSTDGFNYSCKIYFARYNGSLLTTTSNVPNFTYTWNSNLIDLTYSSKQNIFAVTSPATETSSSGYWYLLSMSLVVVVSICFILTIALAIARYIRFKKVAAASTIPDVANSRQETPADPLYGEEPRNGRATVQRTPGFSTSENHDAKHSTPLNYFGADGTQYMEVNAFGRQPMPSRLPTESNMYSAVNEYACIDHTLSPPIPPRGKIA